jgi:hypothetical protein
MSHLLLPGSGSTQGGADPKALEERQAARDSLQWSGSLDSVVSIQVYILSAYVG